MNVFLVSALRGILGLVLAASMLLACSKSVDKDRQDVRPHALNASVCTSGQAWGTASDLQTPRILHTATPLLDGSVLVAGGYSRSAERFEPASNSWLSAGSSISYRRYHTATRLADGRVLLAGGANGEPGASAEVYHPDSNSWATTGSMSAPRRQHSATLLNDGSILAAGGTDAPDVPSAERYHPASGSWTSTGPMHTLRRNHSSTLLANGRVLIVGGEDTSGNLLASAEVYDPSTGEWSPAAGMAQARNHHTATALTDGTVLVVGGTGSGAAATAELYNPATGLWAATGGLTYPRRYHTATLLPDGSVLVAGGYDESSGTLTSVEVYSPATGTWCQAPSMAVPRYGHAATLLADGRVLVAAGFSHINQSSTELLGSSSGCDSIPPSLTLSSPPEGFATRQPQLTLEGRVDDGSCTVTVDGAPIALAGLRFTTQVSLTEGPNTLVLSAEDACHNRATLVRNVHLDSHPPALSFLKPSQSFFTREPWLAVELEFGDEGSGIDPASFGLLLDGKDVSGVLTRTSSGAHGTVPLTPGPHTLVARVADRAGNVTEAQAEGLMELPGLYVVLTSPATGSTFTAPASIRLSATASNSEGPIDHVDFLRDDVVVGSVGSAPYELSLPDVAAGTYVFRARAVDSTGTSALSAPATVTVNALTLSILEPVSGTVVTEGVVVAGTFQAPAGSGVSVNGLPAAISGNTFRVRVPVGQYYPNELTARLTTPQGQSITQRVTVAVSESPSPIQVEVNPASGFAPLAVGFTITNRMGEPLTLVFNDSAPITLPGGARVYQSVLYPAGIHTASIRVTSASGAMDRQSFVIEAIDRAALDQHLRAMWAAMNDALVAGDKERALTFVSRVTREKYGRVFEQLLPVMPSIVASYSPLQGVTLSTELGEYAINRTLRGVNRIFLVYFVRGRDGIWYLESM